MKKILWTLIICYVLLAPIDFMQSDYYLSKNGFVNEVNPLIQNRETLYLAFFILTPILLSSIELAYDLSETDNQKIITIGIMLIVVLLKLITVLNNWMVILS